MNDLALHSIELCAGVGMLGEGVAAALRHIGLQHRTVLYVEREAAAASQLVTLMEAGALHPAPIWSDLLTLDGAAWRGCVDLVIAGFPCQDLSIAGRRAGLNGKRSGLFFNVLDTADACGAWGLVLENVAGIASATATVVDEAEGELEERAAARVLGELADRGWDAEWITLSASDVGASHGRARWFCFAWRVADAQRTEWWPQRVGGAGGKPRHDGRRREAHGGLGVAEAALGNPYSQRDDRCRSPGAKAGCAESAEPSIKLGNTIGNRRGTPFFAPGPADPRWPGIISAHAGLAPAVEPGVRMLADGMAYLLDESRTHQLRQIGNGVVPAQAAAAIVQLFQRAVFMIKHTVAHESTTCAAIEKVAELEIAA